MRINQLAKETGVSIDTIRYYEKIGVLPKAKRSSNGYRIYEEELIDGIKLIIHAKELGFSLKEIKELSQLFLHKRLTPKVMGKKLQVKISEIDEKINQLKKLKKEIVKTVSGECQYKELIK